MSSPQPLPIGVRNRRYLCAMALVVAIALVVRIVGCCWWQFRLPEGVAFGFPDSESYWSLASRVAAGEPFEFGPDRARVFRTPGYPVLLAVLFQVRPQPPVMWARLLGAALGAASVGGVIWIGWRLFDARAALLAGLAAAVYPGAVAVSALVLTETPFTALMLLQLALWIEALRGESRGRRLACATAAGVVAGVATLVRPSWLLFTPLAVVLSIGCGGERKRHLAMGAAMVAALLVTMTPWWIRNGRLTGRPVLTTLQVGASLMDGWHERATGASDMRFVDRQRAEQRAADAASTTAPPSTFEYRLDRRMFAGACRWAREHPGRAARLAVVKFVRTWNIWPNEAAFRSWSLRLVVALSYAPVMVLAAIGSWRFARRGWPFVLCVAPACYFAALHTVFVGSIRYRQPAMLPLIVLAAGLVAVWLRSANVTDRTVRED